MLHPQWPAGNAAKTQVQHHSYSQGLGADSWVLTLERRATATRWEHPPLGALVGARAYARHFDHV